MNTEQTIASLATLDYLRSLFTVAKRNNFTREHVLVIIDNVRQQMASPDELEAYEEATRDIE